MQIEVNHQLVIATESYKFHNDGKTAADGLVLCSSEDFAAARAYQEVLWREWLPVLLCQTASLFVRLATVLQVTVGDDDDAPLLKVSAA